MSKHPHSCQPAEFVIPNGGGFGSGACPLKLKKMEHIHRNGKRIVACSVCAVGQNQRMRVNVDVATGRNVIYGTQGKRKEKVGFSFRKKIHYSEIHILILIS